MDGPTRGSAGRLRKRGARIRRSTMRRAQRRFLPTMCARVGARPESHRETTARLARRWTGSSMRAVVDLDCRGPPLRGGHREVSCRAIDDALNVARADHSPSHWCRWISEVQAGDAFRLRNWRQIVGDDLEGRVERDGRCHPESERRDRRGELSRRRAQHPRCRPHVGPDRPHGPCIGSVRRARQKAPARSGNSLEVRGELRSPG